MGNIVKNTYTEYRTNIRHHPALPPVIKERLAIAGVKYSDLVLYYKDDENGAFYTIKYNQFIDEKDIVMYKLSGKIQKVLDSIDVKKILKEY